MGIFLFYRILRTGKDDRFSEIKNSFYPFLTFWFVSSTWVCLTAAPAIAVLNSEIKNIDNYFIYLGMIIWLFGFLFEVIADMQKLSFKNNSDNKDKFITHGLWSISRHPNYFGEIILWIGISVICIPLLSGWQYISLTSPLFVYLVLTSVSGINILEKRADQKWSKLESYQKYKKDTNELIPKFWH